MYWSRWLWKVLKRRPITKQSTVMPRLMEGSMSGILLLHLHLYKKIVKNVRYCKTALKHSVPGKFASVALSAPIVLFILHPLGRNLIFHLHLIFAFSGPATKSDTRVKLEITYLKVRNSKALKLSALIVLFLRWHSNIDSKQTKLVRNYKKEMRKFWGLTKSSFPRQDNRKQAGKLSRQ